MINAYAQGTTIIPYDSVEFVDDISTLDNHVNVCIHMRDSKKEVTLNSDHALKFVKGYVEHLSITSNSVSPLEVQPRVPVRCKTCSQESLMTTNKKCIGCGSLDLLKL